MWRNQATHTSAGLAHSGTGKAGLLPGCLAAWLPGVLHAVSARETDPPHDPPVSAEDLSSAIEREVTGQASMRESSGTSGTPYFGMDGMVVGSLGALSTPMITIHGRTTLDSTPS